MRALHVPSIYIDRWCWKCSNRNWPWNCQRFLCRISFDEIPNLIRLTFMECDRSVTALLPERSVKKHTLWRPMKMVELSKAHTNTRFAREMACQDISTIWNVLYCIYVRKCEPNRKVIAWAFNSRLLLKNPMKKEKKKKIKNKLARMLSS